MKKRPVQIPRWPDANPPTSKRNGVVRMASPKALQRAMLRLPRNAVLDEQLCDAVPARSNM